MFLSTTSPCQRIQLLSLFCRLFAAVVVCAGLLFGLSISAADAAGGKQACSYHGGGKSLPKRPGFRKMDRPSYDRGSREGHYDVYHGGPVSPSGKIRRYHASKYDRANRGYKTSSGALIISLRSGNSGQMNERAASGITPRIEGDCEVGGYCTVRLGPYLNSPKIITLNTQDADIRPR